MKKKSFKGNHLDERFVAFPQSVLDAPSFFSLSGHAYKLLMDVASQYKGNNNGNLTTAWSVLKKRGWKSKTTLWRCKKELIEAGFLYVTRVGRRPNTCELLALTWFALDVSPKFDPGALHGFEPKAYRPKTALPTPTIKTKIDWTLPNGGRNQIEKNAMPCPIMKT